MRDKSPDRREIKKLTYHISSVEDIINHFSQEGFEILSASFLAFIDMMCPEATDTAPILLEITGRKLEESQQKRIDYAIWLHYRLRLTRLERSSKTCRMKIFWFLICTVLSSLLLYMVTQQTTEVETQFYYLPIWFFGYRLLTYPLQEYLPLRREIKRCRQLAAMKLVFSAEPMSNLSDDILEAVRMENAVYYEQAMDGIRSEELVRQFTKEDGTLILGCRTDSAENLLNPCSNQGNELISGDIADFLEQAEPFIHPKRPVELWIEGCNFTEKEKTEISDAFRNFSRLRYQQAISELKENRRNILAYALGLIASCILLYFCGQNAGLALHEYMLIALWFFGDYLVEFSLLGLSDSKYNVLLRKRLMSMKICFLDSATIF